MSTTTEPPGTLTYEDDDEVLHKFRVSVAEYNLYMKSGQGWLTLYCATDQKISPTDDLPAEPWLEINVPLTQPRDELKQGDKITGSAYDNAFGGWLTNFTIILILDLSSPRSSFEKSIRKAFLPRFVAKETILG